MFRSLITLLLLASMNTSTLVSESSVVPDFNEVNLLTVSAIPVKNTVNIKPIIKAKASLLMDVDSGISLFENNVHKQLPMASLTKIMTAIIILESHDLNEIVTIDENYAALSEDEVGVKIWLRKWEKITVGNLLIGLLVRSGGDAALALAKYHSGSVEAFVDEMNQKTKVLHLSDTNFTNPIGLDAEEHYSTVYDLALLTRYALSFPVFRDIVRMEKATVTSTNGKIVHSFNSTNHLFNSYLDIRGVKTGTTPAAGASLINLAVNDYGHEVISVLLNSPNRFQENKSLIDWGFRTYKW